MVFNGYTSYPLERMTYDPDLDFKMITTKVANSLVDECKDKRGSTCKPVNLEHDGYIRYQYEVKKKSMLAIARDIGEAKYFVKKRLLALDIKIKAKGRMKNG